MGDMRKLEQELNDSFPERKGVIRALLTAAVAGEHAFIMGAPGTGKSLLVRTLAGAFDASYFEYLMTRFTTPEEIFGPVKLSALQADRFERNTAHKLPEAQFAFLDEVWKSNSAVLNTLLTALNERKFHNNGHGCSIPLVSCVGASNELPEGPELDALYDRFLVRLSVGYLSDQDSVRSMLTHVGGFGVSPDAHVDLAREHEAAKSVTIPSEVIDSVITLRAEIAKSGIVVSDRRWHQSLRILRASAYLEDSKSVCVEDLECLENVLWRKPDERSTITGIVQKIISPSGAQAIQLLDQAREVLGTIPKADDPNLKPGQLMAAIAGGVKDVGEILAKLNNLGESRKVLDARSEVIRIKADIAKMALRAAGVET